MPKKHLLCLDVMSNAKDQEILPLSYGLGLLKELIPAPTHVFLRDYHYYQKFDCEQEDEWNVLKTDFEFRQQILKEIEHKGIAIIADEKPVLYGGVVCSDDLILVIGPVVISNVDQSFAKLYALKHKAQGVSLFRTDVKKLAALLLLTYSQVTKKYIYLSDFLDKNFLNPEIIESTTKQIADIFAAQTLANRPHNPGIFEDSIRNAIESGDVEAIKKALNSIYANMRGTLSKNELRSAQNLAIVDVTIATRAAIDAGLSVEELYVISDAFIMEIEDCKYPSDAQALARACALRCTQMVERFKRDVKSVKKLSPIVSRACDYIDRHIYEKLDVELICSKLKVSSSYLSKIFKEEKQMTLGEYSRSRKIEIAKGVLATTDKSIAEIALMFAFTSQSHFGRVFLKVEGISPAQYRKQHYIRDTVF